MYTHACVFVRMCVYVCVSLNAYERAYVHMSGVHKDKHA